jgi:carbon monoxide dehydrogenase subunit G
VWFRFRPVGLEFLETAARHRAVEAHAALPRDVVWRAFSDAATWHEWWPGVRSAGYRGEPPFGVGTIREADVGGFRMEETILAWDEGKRWAYRIDRSTAPIAKAQVEVTELADDGDGTRLRWTVALEPRLVMKLGGPLLEGAMRRMLDRALRNLAAREASRPRGGRC